jgi:hypothetical protein
LDSEDEVCDDLSSLRKENEELVKNKRERRRR